MDCEMTHVTRSQYTSSQQSAVLVSLEEDMGPQVCCADHVAEQGLAEQGHRAEDVGREPVKWENIGQPAEKMGYFFS